jgi:putative hydrolase
MLGDILGLMGNSVTGGSDQLELARTLANSVATGGQPEPNVEPLARMELEELARVAELHISELTGLQVAPGGAHVEIVTVGPGAWAWHTLEDWRFLLDAMSPPSLSQTPPGTQEGSGRPNGLPTGANGGSGESGRHGSLEHGDELRHPGLPEPEASGPELVARFVSAMGPMFAAMQLGSAVGHLSRSVLGQYEVPIPRPAPRILVVPQNLERFASDWHLPLDQVRLWVCLRELTAHAVLTRQHVASRWKELLTNVLRAVAEDSSRVLDRLGNLDPTDPEALQSLLGDPETLLGTSPSPRRDRAAHELEAVTAALLGYVEYVLDQAGSRLLGGRTALAEAWRRRQLDREATDRAAELLFGLDLGPAQAERGEAFVKGVLERAGEEGLGLLWSARHTLPTPSEIEAPGLWLERVRLTDGDALSGGA